MTPASTEEITVALRVLHHWNTSRSIHEPDLARLQKMVSSEQARLPPGELACTIIRQMLKRIELRLVHRKLTSTAKEETDSDDLTAVLNGPGRPLTNGHNGCSELNQ